MNEQITVTVNLEQYNTIKKALLISAAKALMAEDQTAYEMYKSTYLAIMAADTNKI